MEWFSVFNFYIAFSSLMMVAYIWLLFYWSWQWKINGVNISASISEQKPRTDVSVIIPVRNENSNILRVLTCLSGQNYASGKTEIIISDDGSSDDTIELVKSFMNANPSMNIRLLSAGKNDDPGKKNALKRAIEVAAGELILTTDADCIMGPDWIASMASSFDPPEVHMVAGFVKIINGSSFLSRLEQLDYLAMASTGAASILSGKPLLCSGANLAFRKKRFFEVGGYDYGASDPSGDDTYLLLLMKNNATFNSDPRSIVATPPQNLFSDIVSQRIRWASKVSRYREKYIARYGLFLAIVNLNILLMLVISIYDSDAWMIFGLFFLVKAFVDFNFLLPFMRFSGLIRSLKIFLPLQLLYPFYILSAVFISGFVKKYAWKGRTYSAIANAGDVT